MDSPSGFGSFCSRYCARLGVRSSSVPGDAVIADHLGFEITAHRVLSAEAELLAGHQRLIRRLSLQFRVELEPAGEILSVRDIGVQRDEARGRVETLGVELVAAGADAAQACRDRCVELREPPLALPGCAVGADERHIGHWRVEGIGAELERLLEILVVDPEGQRVEQFAPGRQRQHRTPTDHLAGTDNVRAADGRDRAVRGQAIDEDTEPVDFGPRQVRTRHDHGVLRVHRRDLVRPGHGMTELPEIVVAHRDAGTQRRGARALLVVQLDAAVERKRVLDVEIDVDGAGCDASSQRRRDAPVRPAVQRDDVLRDVLKIRQRSFLQ